MKCALPPAFSKVRKMTFKFEWNRCWTLPTNIKAFREVPKMELRGTSSRIWLPISGTFAWDTVKWQRASRHLAHGPTFKIYARMSRKQFTKRANSTVRTARTCLWASVSHNCMKRAQRFTFTFRLDMTSTQKKKCVTSTKISSTGREWRCSRTAAASPTTTASANWERDSWIKLSARLITTCTRASSRVWTQRMSSPSTTPSTKTKKRDPKTSSTNVELQKLSTFYLTYV